MPKWQRGFSDHRIRDWEDYWQHREYIHLNPVRAGLCGDAKEYPYSSYGGGWDAIPQRLSRLHWKLNGTAEAVPFQIAGMREAKLGEKSC